MDEIETSKKGKERDQREMFGRDPAGWDKAPEKRTPRLPTLGKLRPDLFSDPGLVTGHQKGGEPQAPPPPVPTLSLRGPRAIKGKLFQLLEGGGRQASRSSAFQRPPPPVQLGAALQPGKGGG